MCTRIVGVFQLGDALELIGLLAGLFALQLLILFELTPGQDRLNNAGFRYLQQEEIFLSFLLIFTINIFTFFLKLIFINYY
jgi:hypothetical protein